MIKGTTGIQREPAWDEEWEGAVRLELGPTGKIGEEGIALQGRHSMKVD